MGINETVNLSANITLKDGEGNDIAVAYLNSNLDGTNQTFAVSMNVSNKVLLNTAEATNVAGETVQVQYTQFENEVKARAKELGFTIFG